MVANLPHIEHEVPVMFFDTDCGGVIHNLAYLRFVETARTIMAANMGMRLAEMAAEGLYPVVLRTEIDYLSPGKFGDRILVRGGVTEVARVRFWVEFEVVRADDGKVLTKSRQALALIRMPGAKAERLPDEWFK
ncbi:MAG: acyl-CoA thioesterase [Chthoniobacterales bacterium]|jgi:YbgC/YbaW family acyl-CoA thioester hydrolase